MQPAVKLRSSEFPSSPRASRPLMGPYAPRRAPAAGAPGLESCCRCRQEQVCGI